MATTLAAAVTADDNIVSCTGDDLPVASAKLPSTGFRLTVGTEVMWVYESNADGARVVRGIEGTVAAAHAAAATATVGAGQYAVMFTKAGVISDSDFDADALPPVGTLAYDLTNHDFYIREGAATWATLTT